MPKAETVVLTGATAGVGRAVAWRLAKQGARIGLLARGRAGLDAVKREVEQLGGEAAAISVDVANADQVQAAADQIESQFGPLDLWINDAMTSVFSPAKDMTPEEFKRVTEVTYLGYVYGTLTAMRSMIPRDHGTIVQVGSALAYRGIPLQSAYCGAKHAIQGFTESVRCELLHDRSRVKITMVQLPAMNTPQFQWVKSRLARKPQPVPPIYQPEVAADAIVWAAHHYRREWWVAYPTVLAIAGNKVAPGYGDHYLAKNGYDSQQYDGEPDADRKDNLFQPADDETDFGAHGNFDSRANNHSWQFELDKYRKWLAIAGTAVGGLIAAKMARSQTSNEMSNGSTRRCSTARRAVAAERRHE